MEITPEMITKVYKHRVITYRFKVSARDSTISFATMEELWRKFHVIDFSSL